MKHETIRPAPDAPAFGKGASIRDVCAFLAVATVLFLIPSFLNGFPFVHDDTGTYLPSGVDRSFPRDRPIFYGLFAVLIHWKVSPWPIVIVQSVLTAFVLWTFARRVFDVHNSLALLAMAVFLAVGSTVPWFTGRLTPDIFAPILVLCLLLLWTAWEKLVVWERVLAAFSVFAIVTFHYGNVGLALGSMAVFGVIYLAGWRPSGKLWPRAVAIVGATLLAASALITANTLGFKKPALSPTSSNFMFARLLDTGEAMDFLAKDCPSGAWKICSELETLETYRANIAPGSLPLSDFFLWHGPQDRLGGFLQYADEAGDLLVRIVENSPARVFWHVLENTAAQFFRFQVNFNAVPADGGVDQAMTRLFGQETREATFQSAQNRSAIPYEAINAWYYLITAVSAAALLYGAVMAWRRDPIVTYAALALLLFLIGNAVMTGGLIATYDRYQARLIWLVPLFACLMIARWRGLRPPAEGLSRAAPIA
jgi:hypothetical protein